MESKLRPGLGTIKGSEITKNRDSDSNIRLLNAELSSPEDIQSVELATESGVDFVPENEDVALVIPLSEAYKLGLIIDDQVAPDPALLPGEKEIYSKVAGAKLAKIKLDKFGNIILNGGIDFAVQFTALKAKFDSLQAQLIAHTHLGVTTGPGTSGVSATVFDVDISAAKVDKVKL